MTDNLFTPDLREIVLHALGVNGVSSRCPEFRNYYCADSCNPKIMTLTKLGYMELTEISGGRTAHYCVTEAGKEAVKIDLLKANIAYLRHRLDELDGELEQLTEGLGL